MFETDVAEHRVADIQVPQAGHFANVRHAGIGDVDAADHEPPQCAIRAQMRHRRIRQKLGRVEREIFELLERLQLLDALVGHVGERQVERLQRLQLDDEVDVVVCCPGAFERRFDDRTVFVARHPSAALLDSFDGIGDSWRILRARLRCDVIRRQGGHRCHQRHNRASYLSNFLSCHVSSLPSCLRAFVVRGFVSSCLRGYVLRRARPASRLQLMAAFGSALLMLL